MGRFLSVGECMVEVAPAGDGLFRVGHAGDAFNAAWYARRLLPPDWDVAFASRVGIDGASDEMLAFLCAEGIAVDAVARDPERTLGLYMIRLADGERSFSYWRDRSAARRLGDDRAWLAEVLARRDVVLFTGITLAILPPAGRANLLAALGQARAAGALVAFDTNARPRLWEGADAMREGLMAGAAAADVVLPSFDEEAALFGDRTPAATAARYAAEGARVVAVKDGAAPVTLLAEGRTQSIPAVPLARVVDSTAAGDSFAGGFLAALATGAAPADAVRRAAALAARVVGGRGALVRAAVEGPVA